LVDSKINGLKEIKIDNETDFFVSQPLYFQFCPHVFGDFSAYETQKSGHSGGSAYTEEHFTIVIYSWKKSLQDLKDILETWEAEYHSSFIKQTITLTGSLEKYKHSGEITSFQFSDRFFAVLHKIGNLDHGETNPELVELHLKEPGRASLVDRTETPEHKRREVSRLVPKEFKFNENISGTLDWYEDKDNKSKMIYTISIHSTMLTSSQMSSAITSWEKEYENFKFCQNGLRFYSYNPTPKSEGEDFNEFPFESSKSFQNVFFKEKDKIVSRVKFFLENESWYAARGVPYTLGLLLHGLPGTGKTSTIKALANLTQRHIVSVPLKNIKNIEDLYKVFYGPTINKKTIPVNKRIYVLEDIDAASLKETVKRREPATINSTSQMDDGQEVDSGRSSPSPKHQEKGVLLVKQSEETEEKNLTLADLLEVFDGVMEMKGRIMVITTNHPEKLDPALIRPGRIDVNIQFGYCQPDDVLEIFNNFYGEDRIPAGFDKSNLARDNWTAAEVMQVFLNNTDKPSEGLNILCNQQGRKRNKGKL